MARWTRGTSLLLACAILCFAAGVSLAQQSNGMDCSSGSWGCIKMNPGDCYPNGGTCQNANGQLVNFDGFNNSAVWVGRCYPGTGYCDQSTPIKVCSTVYYATDGITTCATPVCSGNANGYNCPNPGP